MGEKIKVEELGCFEQVAKVIGVERAKVELFKVINKTPSRYIWDYTVYLSSAFNWSETEQPLAFWRDICAGINPYE